MSSTIIISLKEVEEILKDDSRCSPELAEEIIETLVEIDSKKDRMWIFTSVENKYYIDEYNNYKDLVKTIKFKV
jgi:hypothetical protein